MNSVNTGVTTAANVVASSADDQAADHGATGVRTFVLSSRRTLTDLLAASLRVTGTATLPGPELMEAGRNGAVLVVDGAMDPEDRLLITGLARARSVGMAVVVVFCDPDPLALARWVEAGASAVLNQTASLIEINDVLRRVARNETILGVSVREGLLSHLRSQRQSESDRTTLFAGLTKREAQVLRGLSMGATPEEISRAGFVSLNTVRTQIRAVLAKLGVTSVVAAVALAYRTGWIAPDLQ